ncbi:MAG: hypothetical protein ABIJ18_02895 [archaeon]
MSILQEVMAKKEYQGLDERFVSSVILKYLPKYDTSKKSGKDKLIKEVRAKLREVYGAFRAKNYDKKFKFLDGMNQWDDKLSAANILKVHLSTRERIEYNDKVYNWIKSYIDFNSVLDLGCGFNVFSMPWMGKVNYYGIDINRDDVDFCNKYMSKFSLSWGIRWANLLTFDNYVFSDVCFMFKILDGLESIERGASAKLLSKIRSQYIVASFATKSLGGKKVISAKRLKWFEDMVIVTAKKRFGDEIYYIIKR